MKIDLFEPFRRSETKRRPILTYSVGFSLPFIFLVAQMFIEEWLAVLLFFIFGISWSLFCRWKKWA